ncbi:MAG: 4-hydroxy-tetrahydrodipicolinate reductase [Clostridia bacterium]|nr:4-hydroxy-tetrahydrodipicolinate reductase [Clostridia bacterium]
MILLVNGCKGRMGQALTRLGQAAGHTVYGADQDAPLAALPQGDVIVDFSCPEALETVLSEALKRKIPAVICTTGHTEAQKEAILEAAKTIPLFHAGNTSLGVAQLCRMVRETAKLFPQAQIEIVETHHIHKKDAPSGTAKMLFEAAKEARPDAVMTCGRQGLCPRSENEIGVHALRRGEVIGIHEVHISTPTQTLTLRHEAHDRSLFAEGALTAAEFLMGQPPRLYDMKALLK